MVKLMVKEASDEVVYLRKLLQKHKSDIAKDNLSKEENLRIVRELIGRTKRIHEDDIYQCMIDLNDMGKNITISRIAGLLDLSLIHI